MTYLKPWGEDLLLIYLNHCNSNNKNYAQKKKHLGNNTRGSGEHPEMTKWETLKEFERIWLFSLKA